MENPNAKKAFHWIIGIFGKIKSPPSGAKSNLKILKRPRSPFAADVRGHAVNSLGCYLERIGVLFENF
jgi:hypothetical protein